MKLSISNIAWERPRDEDMYAKLRALGYAGVEIAPTRLFEQPVYDRLKDAALFKDHLFAQYGLVISSIQSIWYGRTENFFADESQRLTLLNYTKEAIAFAEACGCGNLVFGCPKNRLLTPDASPETAIPFFRALGDYAAIHHTVVSIEANPTIYGTNYINRTEESFALAERVNSAGFKVNLDVGTIVQNDEDVMQLRGRTGSVNHIHISEPNLERIRKRALHRALAKILRDEDYKGFISVEMKMQGDIAELVEVLTYVGEVFA